MKPSFLILSLASFALGTHLVHRQDSCNKDNCYNDVWPNPSQIARGVTDCLNHLITTISINPVTTRTILESTITTTNLGCSSVPIGIPPSGTATASATVAGERYKIRQAPPAQSSITTTTFAPVPPYADNCDSNNYSSACGCSSLRSARITLLGTTTTVFATITQTSTVTTEPPCAAPSSSPQTITPSSSSSASSTSSSFNSSSTVSLSSSTGISVSSSSVSNNSSSSSGTTSSFMNSTRTSPLSSMTRSSTLSNATRSLTASHRSSGFNFPSSIRRPSSSVTQSSLPSTTEEPTSFSSTSLSTSFDDPGTSTSSSSSDTSSLTSIEPSSTSSSSFSSLLTSSTELSSTSSRPPNASSSSFEPSFTMSSATTSQPSNSTRTFSSFSTGPPSSSTSSNASLSWTFSTHFPSSTTPWSYPTPIICDHPGVGLCDGKCRELNTDLQHCGACGNACNTSIGKYCEHGVCVSRACDSNCELDRLCNHNGTSSCVCATETGGAGVCFDKAVFTRDNPQVVGCNVSANCLLGFVCVRDYFSCNGTTGGLCVSTEGCGRQGAAIVGPLALREGMDGKKKRLFQF